MSDVYEEVSRLMQLWSLLEDKLKKIEIIDSSSPLSLVRHGSKMRLCYIGKPISECTIEDKIEATIHVAKFMYVYSLLESDMLKKIEQGCKEVEKCIKSLE